MITNEQAEAANDEYGRTWGWFYHSLSIDYAAFLYCAYQGLVRAGHRYRSWSYSYRFIRRFGRFF